MRERAVVGVVVLVLSCDSGTEPGDSGAGTGSATVDEGASAEGMGSESGMAETTGAPGDDPLGMVAAHNAVRASAQPAPDPPLPAVVWDAQLAEVAQAWADACVFEHSDNGFGENLYAGSGTPEAQAAVDSWADEASMYDYATNGCSGVCGHYTQIVWRDTERIGCGFADCPTLVGAGFSGRFWVCNYDPPGNFIGERPY